MMTLFNQKEFLENCTTNKGLAFTESERERYRLNGHLPPAIQTQNQQVELVIENLNRLEKFDDGPLLQYEMLRNLEDHNQRLFYRVLAMHIGKIMPLVYTPVVGLACQQYSHLLPRRSRGLFLTIHDIGRVAKILESYSTNIRYICVTDGERILGLGDLGANGMGIPIGKLTLISAFGGLPPEVTLPVTIDVGTNNQSLLDDPFYIGLRQKRINDENRYDKFVDEFMQAIIEKWGPRCTVMFEDFGNQNAFRLLLKYQNDYCMFNDDIQGTASVVVAGFLTSLRLTTNIKRLSQHRFLFFGAGEAGLGIASLLVVAMQQLDKTEVQEARRRISMVDKCGFVTKNRPPSSGMDGTKKLYAKNEKNTKDLLEIIDIVEPTVLIGVAAVSQAFNEKVLRRMAQLNSQPVIFSLSNPTSKAECTAEQAYRYTDGRCIFASGSPFNPVQFQGKTFIPTQGNNSYIFPAIAVAIVVSQSHRVPEEVFLVAAEILSKQVTNADLINGSIYPPLNRTSIEQTSLLIATGVLEWLYDNNYAHYQPEPKDKYAFLKSVAFNPSYECCQKTFETYKKFWNLKSLRKNDIT